MADGRKGDDSPNVLMIMVDQLSALALPSYGHAQVKAPNITALASGGVVFKNAYCNFPLCAPSRISMLSGRLASTIGAYDNSAETRSSVPTIAHYLRASGYRTVLSGKMHFVGADQLHGYEQRLTTDIYPADFGWTPDWTREPTSYAWSHHAASVVEAGPCSRNLQMDFDDEAVFRGERKLYECARSPNKKRFFLTVSLTQPHDPYNCALKYWNMYEPGDIDLPRVPMFTPEQMDPHSRRLYYQASFDRYRLTDERVRNARRAYYGMVSYVDDVVGRFLRVVTETGLAESTMVIFMSDHGDMLGERGMWYKMTFFEWASRVPLIFYWPGHYAPHIVSDNVSLLDVAPTVRDLCCERERASSPLSAMDGASLMPYLRGGPSDTLGERPIFAEYLAEGATGPRLMIKRKNLKYVFSEIDPVELYDLEKDQDELVNASGSARYEESEQELRALALSRWSPSALRSTIIEDQQRRLLIHRALSNGEYTSWDYQPQVDPSTQYVRNRGVEEDALKAETRFPPVQPVPPDFGPSTRAH